MTKYKHSVLSDEEAVLADLLYGMKKVQRLATFKEKQYSHVAMETRQLLIDNKMSSYRDPLLLNKMC